MPEYFRECNILFAGEWPEESQGKLRKKLLSYKGSFFHIVAKCKASQTDVVPDGFSRMQEIELAQEIIIAGRSDIVVYGNSGAWSNTKRLHLQRLGQAASAVVIWTPIDIEDSIPSEQEIVPGYVQVHGRINILARIIAYLCLGSRSGGEEISLEEEGKDWSE